MTLEQFQALLERRDQLRTAHEEWCADVNGRLGAGGTSYEARRRDQTYAELEEVEALIEAELEAERARETAE